MYAIVKSGSRQYRANVGNMVLVDRLPLEVGQQLTLDDVLLVSDGEQVKVGQPTVEGAKVLATVVAQEEVATGLVGVWEPEDGQIEVEGEEE